MAGNIVLEEHNLERVKDSIYHACGKDEIKASRSFEAFLDNVYETDGIANPNIKSKSAPKKTKPNPGARRYAARKAAAARGSKDMPELAPGHYLAVIDSISGEAIIDIEMGDLWVIDDKNNRHLHYGFIGIGGGFTVGGSISRQFGALYGSSAEGVGGVSFQLEMDGISGLGATGTFQITNQSFDPSAVLGGMGVGLEAGFSGVMSYAWFKKVYSKDESPMVFSL